MRKMNQLFIVLSVLVLLLYSGCQSTARKVVYSAWETVGVEKRDLLKDRIEDARDDQKDAGKSFGDALDRLRAIYKVDNGKLAQHYDKLKGAYEDAEKDASDVRKSIQKVEVVAGDLFVEWEKELGQISNSELRHKSRDRLTETKKKYGDLHASLKAAESKMDPVLKAFKDQVLYMKHNLNAQAIASLKGESINIEKDIKQLIERMNKSIAEADQFVKGLNI